MAKTHDCMTAFFHSAALREMAPGLADFIARPEGHMRLLASPYLTQDDQAAIKEGMNNAPDILAKRLEELYGSTEISVSALLRHTLECLAYLISVNRITIKLVLVRDGLFHPKVRIFSDGIDYIAVHGSNNLTRSGFTTNVEQVVVSRSWISGDQERIVQRLRDEFNAIWNNEKSDYIRTCDLPQAFRERIVKDFLPERMPTVGDFKQAWKYDSESGVIHSAGSIVSNHGNGQSVRRFEIPSSLNYLTGDFAHQGLAVTAWEKAGRRGILEMATGSGKTIAALIAAKKCFDDSKPLMLVISAPYLPLISQWSEEVRKFGLKPVVPGMELRKTQKLAVLRQAIRNLNLGVASIACVVITHDFLCDPEFQTELSRYSGKLMLIADEVHNLGTPRFLEETPDAFDYRLGLSATPIRQYDEIGTERLVKYFGDIAFRFTLKEAIGKCLVPYNYYVHPVELTEEELEEWLQLSDRLKKMGWAFDEAKDGENGKISTTLQKLLNRRRRILEQANSKLDALHNILLEQNPSRIRHTLVYASDKGREQLRSVNSMLMDDLRLRIHQITQEETGKTDLTDKLLLDFATGSLQVLTAMRVLDEGVDIPEVSTAFILASTTVERQWVQRRGRVLRKCSRIDKKLAHIHDFLVLPPKNIDPDIFGRDVIKILKKELERVMEFAKISSNAAAPDGALTTIRPIIEAYF
jgi:superfamily II DNA or RNA helicase